jgi:cholesterol oxidase
MPRSLHFPETLTGRVTFTRSTSSDALLQEYPFTMHLRWSIPDLDAFFDDPRHPVNVSGQVRCEPLGGDLTVSDGSVECFALEPDGQMVMNYVLSFPAGNDQPLVLQGTKEVVHDRPNDLWPDTTTLPVEVRQADGEQELVAAGRLRLSVFIVARAVIGMRATGGPRQALRTIIAFDRFFLAKLASVYLGPVRRSVQAAAF